jgi:hypothetical protein
MIDLSDEIKEQVYRALGQAVVHVWSNLPHDIQQHLFEAAVRSQGETMRPSIAVFLHEKHARTTDALKSRATPEPDSLGG